MNHKGLALVPFLAVLSIVVILGGANTDFIVVYQQTLAFSGHGGAYGFYGPCIIRHFSYTWCLNIFSTKAPGGLLTVINHVVGGPAKPSDFIMGVFSGCNAKTTSFPGSERGTTVSLGPTSCAYNITERGPFINNYTLTVSGECSGYLNPGDKKTCIETNTFVPGDHT
jgi:hypothetical protein